jgi:hypothetical protein
MAELSGPTRAPPGAVLVPRGRGTGVRRQALNPFALARLARPLGSAG